MIFGSVFAGIGGFDLGLEAAGLRCRWQIEQDEYARSVLRRHWPGVKRRGDVSDVDRLPSVDLMCGGFPCQDVSTAGQRKGVDGERSGLFREFFRLVRLVGPEYILLENVPGLLSRAEWMGAVLGEMAECGYDAEWKVLDSQFFGVPQRRERVFLVGYPRGLRRRPILVEPDGVPGHFTAGRAAREGSPARVVRGVAASGGQVSGAVCPRNARGADSSGRSGFVAAQCHGSNVGPPGTLLRGNGAVSGGVPFLAYRPDNYTTGSYGEDSVSGPVTTMTDASRGPGLAVQVSQRREGRIGETAGALTEPSGTQANAVMEGWRVRRYTPRECERLQGFPDDHTSWGLTADGDRVEISDTQRYKMLGNAVTVPVAEWIGRCLQRPAG